MHIVGVILRASSMWNLQHSIGLLAQCDRNGQVPFYICSRIELAFAAATHRCRIAASRGRPTLGEQASCTGDWQNSLAWL
jgi:hypothetical protein